MTSSMVRSVLDRARRGPVLFVALILAALTVLYAALVPHAPDLAAQLARATAASHGVRLWWAGWYGGIDTATYSLVSGSLMGLLGVPAVGILATVALCLLGADLVRHSARPRAGAVAVTVAACANLYSGRITFAAWMAVALAGFVLHARGRPRAAAATALLTGAVSPLAAMYPVVGLAALAVDRPSRWRSYALTAVSACLPVAAVSLLFPQASHMPFDLSDCLLALLVCAGVALAPVPRVVRVLAALSAAVAVGAWLVPSPIGSNAVRLPMLAAAPLVVATASGGQRRARVLALALVLWPAISFSNDMAVAAQPSAQGAFYAPLLQHLQAPGPATQRLEVLDPESHAADYYLSQHVPLARGWERQIDLADNPLFYDGSLTATSYREWLVTHAVGWVAVPSGPLDYGAQAEQGVLAAPPSYLRLVWEDQDWRLYRVVVPTPAATAPLKVQALTGTGVDLLASRAGTGLVRLPYNPMLTVRASSGGGDEGCVQAAGKDTIAVTVPAPGAYRLRANLTLAPSTCTR